MDCYTHLDMRVPDPIEDLRLQMSSAKIDRALIVETWGKDNFACLEHLIASPSPQFRIALCFRPEEGGLGTDVLQQEMVAALRVKTADNPPPGEPRMFTGVLGKMAADTR